MNKKKIIPYYVTLNFALKTHKPNEKETQRLRLSITKSGLAVGCPLKWDFLNRASSDPCGSARTNAASLGQQRHFDARRANADPQSRVLPHAGRIPLGEVQGRAQGFRHGRQGTLGSQAARQRHTAENIHSRCCAAFALGALPTEAEAARPPKG